jgi:hypothetical protein
MDIVVQPLLWPDFPKSNENLPKYKETECKPEKHEFISASFSKIIREAIDFQSKTPLITLPPSSFIGAGIYAIYYQPDKNGFDVYAGLSTNIPIYVGKAVNPGWRTNRSLNTNNTQSLYSRLKEHAISLQKAYNLLLEHFTCQFTIIKDTDLIVPVEAEMIRNYSPLWNTTIDGFGNHDPGKGRINQAKSAWDILHPGREWADKCKGNPLKSKQELLREVTIYVYKQQGSL